MNFLPLLTHTSMNDALAYRDGEVITVQRFLEDVEKLHSRLLAGQFVLNVCRDRYHFMVGFAAIMTANKTSMLPSTYTHETINQLRSFAPDVFCLSDESNDIDLPSVSLLANATHAAGGNCGMTIPMIPENFPVSYVFTSGSTGKPVPHLKRWGSLVKSVRAAAQRLGLLDGRKYSLIGTVPPQHMYGFESTILMVLQCGGALSAPPNFYPADICKDLSSLPRPRLLVSTPIHLTALLSIDANLPTVDLLLSATAPLSKDLAYNAEKRFAAPLIEIYGSTETGQVATRRSAEKVEWSLLPELHMTMSDSRAWVSGGHLEQAKEINDVVELLGNGHFLLHGRVGDLINIAGKRSSLAYLNHQLLAIPGVQDGAFFMPENDERAGVQRLMAFVVAPAMTYESMYAHLRERIEPAFLPRPLRFVKSLPRNQTGKLSQDALRTLAESVRPDED